MGNNHLHTESIELLISEIRKYQDELLTNRNILMNAANACDVAMGSDDISKKYIERLLEALEELDKTSEKAEELVEALINEEQAALDVYNS